MFRRKRQFKQLLRDIERDVQLTQNSRKRRRKINRNNNIQIVRQELNFGTLLQNLNNTAQNQGKKSTNTDQCDTLTEDFDTLPVHQGLMDLYEHLSPTPEEHFMRLDLIKDIRKLIQNVWPSSIVEAFGSFCTGAYLPDGDIDLVVFGNWPQEMIRSKKVYYYLADALAKNSLVKRSSVQVIGFAKVPIVKFEDSRYNVNFDVSFNAYSGLDGCEFLKNAMKEFPCLRSLIILIKQFLVEKKLNSVFTGGLSSYSLYMMILSYLQRHPRANILRTNTNVNIAILLIEFFDLYGRLFNYDNICIDVVNGVYKKRKDFYRQYNLTFPTRASVCIEDPCCPGNDIGRGSYCVPEIKLSFLKAKTQLVQLLKNML